MSLERDRLTAPEEESPEFVLDTRIRREERRSQHGEMLLVLVVVATVTYLLFGVVFGLAVVKGSSMNPAYREGDVVLFLRLCGHYRQGDVVFADLDEYECVKRIVAVPGQTVDIDEEKGALLIDGEPLIEPYTYTKTDAKPEVSYPLVTGEDEYFLLGDNRRNSVDSRNYGPIAREDLDGKAIFIFRIQK